MSEPAAPQPKWLYSIVIAGAIDPRQHVPEWYRTIGVLKDDEVSPAIKTVHFIDAGGLRFQGPGFVITATNEKWQISTVSESNTTKILDITSLVFEKLYEVFVLAFGVNLFASLPTSATHVGRALRQSLITGGLPIPPGETPDTNIMTAQGQADGTTISLQIQQGDLPNFVSLGYGVHHPLQGLGQFDLGALIRRHAGPEWQQAAGFAENLARQVGEFAEAQRG